MAATYTHVSAKKDLKETGVNKTAYAIGFAIGLVLLIFSAIVAHSHTMTGWQLSFFHTINNLGGGLKQEALWITEGLGAGYGIAAVVLIPLLYRRYRLSWRFFFTIGGSVVVMEAIKQIINEPRPIAMLGAANLHQRAVETGPGFPSGHEVAATAMALTLWLILPRAWRWLSIFWILIVGFSRLYLGVHAPVDIICGFAIGLMAVCVVALLPDSLAKPLRLDNEVPLLKRYDWPSRKVSAAQKT
jgi:membrane-associated phospholipid phosphatase